MADYEDASAPPVVDDSRLPMNQEDHPAHNLPTATEHHNGTDLGTQPYHGTMLSDSVVKTYQAFRKLGEPRDSGEPINWLNRAGMHMNSSNIPEYNK